MDIKLPGGFRVTLTKESRPKPERPKCEQCHKEYGFFRKRHKCKFCDSVRCRDCIKQLPNWRIFAESLHLGEGQVCPECWDSRVEPQRRVGNRFKEGALNKIQIFPRTYRGEIPVIDGSRQPEMRTLWFKEKSHVEISLRCTADLLGCNVVVDVDWEQDTNSEAGNGNGTHYFTVWRAMGFPARLSKTS